MAHNKGTKKTVPFVLNDLNQYEVTQNQHQSDSEREHEQNDNSEEQYFVDETSTEFALPNDAATCAQSKDGQAAFVEKRKQTMDEQGYITLNSCTSVEDAWKVLKNKKTPRNVEEIWEGIDEEEAPMPNFNNESKFAKYDKDLIEELDVLEMNDNAYLLKQLAAANKLLIGCREESMRFEKAREQAMWERKQAQKKAARFESFAKHVVHRARNALEWAERQKFCNEKTRTKLENWETDLKQKFDTLDFSQAELVKEVERGLKEFDDRRKDLKKLKAMIIDGDEGLRHTVHEIGSDIHKQFEQEAKRQIVAGLAQDKIERLAKWSSRQAEQNKTMRKLELDRGQTQHKIETSLTQKVKDNIYASGVKVGNLIGRKITALDQYKRGYFFGARNATNSQTRARLEEAEATGRNAGLAEMQEYNKEVYYPAMLKLFAQKHSNALAAAVLKTRNEVLQEVSHEFADFTNKNERRVKDVSAAWATWKAIVTQARRVTNEPGSEEEEMRQAELVARIFAGEAAKYVANKTWGKSPWRALSSEDSPLFTRSAHIQKTSFYKVFMTQLKLARSVALQQLCDARQAQIDREEERAAQLDAQHAAIDTDSAARAPNDDDFQLVEDGVVSAWPPNPLPPIIVDEEEEDAVEFSADKLPPAWWKPQSNPFAR